jgi:hypothetical protein
MYVSLAKAGTDSELSHWRVRSSVDSNLTNCTVMMYSYQLAALHRFTGGIKTSNRKDWTGTMAARCFKSCSRSALNPVVVHVSDCFRLVCLQYGKVHWDELCHQRYDGVQWADMPALQACVVTLKHASRLVTTAHEIIFLRRTTTHSYHFLSGRLSRL